MMIDIHHVVGVIACPRSRWLTGAIGISGVYTLGHHERPAAMAFLSLEHVYITNE
jgi:hypothetical protein